MVVANPSIIELTKHDNPTKFVGEGRLSHAPEYVELSVTVRSECYPTAHEASQATDAAAAKIMKNLRGHIDADHPKDGIFSEGGFSEPFSRYLSSNHTVCLNTFQKTTSITMKTSKIDALSQGFDVIQRDIFTTMREPTDKSKAQPMTYASLSKPQSQLYYETRERLEKEALADALKNAREKFEITAKMGCGVEDYEILTFVESSASAGRPIAYGRSAPSADGASHALEFDAIWINKLLDVTFLAKSAPCKM